MKWLSKSLLDTTISVRTRSKLVLSLISICVTRRLKSLKLLCWLMPAIFSQLNGTQAFWSISPQWRDFTNFHRKAEEVSLSYQTIIPPSSSRKRQQDALRQNINHLLRINKKRTTKNNHSIPIFFMLSLLCLGRNQTLADVLTDLGEGVAPRKTIIRIIIISLLNVGLSDSFARNSQVFYSRTQSVCRDVSENDRDRTIVFLQPSPEAPLWLVSWNKKGNMKSHKSSIHKPRQRKTIFWYFYWPLCAIIVQHRIMSIHQLIITLQLRWKRLFSTFGA